jgi:hypothetical protein
MNISSRTPEGDPNHCPFCGHDLRLEPSQPLGDAPCPSCGSLLWFPAPPVPPLLAAGLDPEGELIPEADGDSIALVRPRLRLGRRESCDICLRHPNVSGVHCELIFQDGHWNIRDLNSTNGVKVNGVRVIDAVLYPGDVISIAKRGYRINYTPPVGSAPVGNTPSA